jgi:D-serine deaminase-like pyridoxal phosphate-dependent protein
MHVLDPDRLLPAMTLRETAIANNLSVMQAFCDRHGLVFAPHMKTHMSPELARRQIAAGSWGVTVANVQQALVAWDAGIHHLVVANEVLDPGGLARLAALRASDPASDITIPIDSAEGVARAAAAMPHGPIDVLVDVGWAGGRTGVRGADAARDLAAQAVAAGLTVRGVFGYEGGLPDVDSAREYVAQVLAIAESLPAGPDGRTILTIGGSAYFDGVVDALADRPDHVDVILRSGSYLTHDDGTYARGTPFNRIPAEGTLLPAIEVWARVTSTPEPGLALIAAGRRDVPYDSGLPVVRRVVPGGSTDARPVASVPGALTVDRVDDQHGYVRLADGATLTPGDVLVLGISHPCTAFDKWREVDVIDDDDRVVDTIRTWF